jgi:hypothetical protein
MLTWVETALQILGYPGLAIIFFLVAAGGGIYECSISCSSTRKGNRNRPTIRTLSQPRALKDASCSQPMLLPVRREEVGELNTGGAMGVQHPA